MKARKYSVLFGSVFAVVGLMSCETRTYDEVSEPAPIVASVNYTENIKPIMTSNCTVCHSTTGNAAYYPLENYTQVKNAIDNIINRVERPNGDPLKMPKGGALSNADISLLKQWKAEGLAEQ